MAHGQMAAMATKSVVVLLEDGKGTLSNADVPTGMKPNQNYTNGHWDQTPDTTVGSISGNHTYTYLYDIAASVPSTPAKSITVKNPAAVSASTPQIRRSVQYCSSAGASLGQFVQVLLLNHRY